MDEGDTSFEWLHDQLARKGYGEICAAQLGELLGMNVEVCSSLFPLWNELPPDTYLLDGGHYRFRRHGSFVQRLGPASSVPRLLEVPQRAHWQPKTYNALHGDLTRWFAPLPQPLVHSVAWEPLLVALGEYFATIRPSAQWFIEAHQFRITTDGGIGRPTPEGAHRDGVDFVAILLIDRHQISGGETRIYTTDGTELADTTLNEPCDALLLDDLRVLHETTPIIPQREAGTGWRDTLVLTYRAKGFLDPA